MALAGFWVIFRVDRSYSLRPLWLPLAGLQVGFVVGHSALIEALEEGKNSFNSYPLGRLAIVGVVTALEDTGHFEFCWQ